MKLFGMNLQFNSKQDGDVDTAGTFLDILNRQSKDETRYTPDYEALQEKQAWWVFVPDESMSGHPMSWLMDPSEPRLEAFTAKEDWIMWRKYLGQKTMAVPMLADTFSYIQRIKLNGRTAYPAARIRGQLYLVSPRQFKELDTYKQNGVMFCRTRVSLLVPYTALTEYFVQELAKNDKGVLVPTGVKVPAIHQESTLSYMEAWMYHGLPDFWKSYSESQFFEPTNPRSARHLGKMKMEYYYQFGIKDYQKGEVAAPSIINGRTEDNT